MTLTIIDKCVTQHTHSLIEIGMSTHINKNISKLDSGSRQPVSAQIPLQYKPDSCFIYFSSINSD